MRILQLTDFHLLASQEGQLHGYYTYDCLKQVINYIIAYEGMKADAVIITGDVSQDGSASSYSLALRQLERLDLPLYFIPGNHDNPLIMASVLKNSPLVHPPETLYQGDWRFIPVSTVQPGKDSGFFSKKQQIKAEQDILNSHEMNVVLLMHHHPVPVGIPLVDECRLMNGSEVLSLCDRYPQIKAIVCGHAHTQDTKKYHDCVISVCPATCFQWSLGATDIRTEDNRGFSLLEFNGAFQSETVLL